MAYICDGRALYNCSSVSAHKKQAKAVWMTAADKLDCDFVDNNRYLSFIFWVQSLLCGQITYSSEKPFQHVYGKLTIF